MGQDSAFLIDLDDTLLATGDLYCHLRTEFFAVLNRLGVAEDTALSIFEQVETRNTRLQGHAPQRYAASMVETLELATRNVTSADRTSVESIGLRLLDEFPELVPDALETLARLRSWGRLFLVTRGHADLQQRKIQHHRLADLFDDTWIVQQKTAAEFRQAIAKWGLDDKATWVIGDSIPADINPAITCGLRAILTPYPSRDYRWIQDHAVPISHQFFRASQLSQAPDIVKYESDTNILELVESARAVTQRAYAPYSGLAVGAAVRSSNGAVYPGTNVENASLGLTMCAEQVAIATAISAGSRELLGIAISAFRENAWSLVMPCGRCRQWLVELLGSDVPVAVCGPDGIRIWRVEDLLPSPFLKFA
jgi:cytidine deaminase